MKHPDAIASCRECDRCRLLWISNGHGCFHPRAQIWGQPVGREIPDGMQFPDWCPLPDAKPCCLCDKRHQVGECEIVKAIRDSKVEIPKPKPLPYGPPSGYSNITKAE